jgi:Predicted acyltransferases
MKEKEPVITPLSINCQFNYETKRLYYLDNLKIALTCLVLIHHASQAYVSIQTGWVIQQGNIPEINNMILGWFMSVNNAFFMALFFMISAYFIPSSLEHKSLPVFIKDRAKRLGIPILLFILIIFPVIGFLLNSDGLSIIDFVSKRYFNLANGEINLGHVWFLFDLLVFSCIYALLSRLHKKQPENNDTKKSQKKLYYRRKAPDQMQILRFILILTVLTFAVRLVFSPGYWMPLHSFEPAKGVLYIAMFSIGILSFRKQWMEILPVSTGVIWGIVSIGMILLAPPIIIIYLKGYDMWATGFSLQSLIVSAWETALCVGLCISLPVLFRQKLNFTNNLLKSAAKSSFTVYLIHPFIVMPLQMLLINIPIHPFLEFIIVSIAGIILCYALCQLFFMIKSTIHKIKGVKVITNEEY